MLLAATLTGLLTGHLRVSALLGLLLAGVYALTSVAMAPLSWRRVSPGAIQAGDVRPASWLPRLGAVSGPVSYGRRTALARPLRSAGVIVSLGVGAASLVLVGLAGLHSVTGAGTTLLAGAVGRDAAGLSTGPAGPVGRRRTAPGRRDHAVDGQRPGTGAGRALGVRMEPQRAASDGPLAPGPPGNRGRLDGGRAHGDRYQNGPRRARACTGHRRGPGSRRTGATDVWPIRRGGEWCANVNQNDVMVAADESPDGLARRGPLLEARNVTARLKSRARGPELEVLQEVSLEVARGQAVCVAGRSGSGKTTLLTIASGLMPPSSGSVPGRVRPSTSSMTGNVRSGVERFSA